MFHGEGDQLKQAYVVCLLYVCIDSSPCVVLGEMGLFRGQGAAMPYPKGVHGVVQPTVRSRGFTPVRMAALFGSASRKAMISTWKIITLSIWSGIRHSATLSSFTNYMANK